MKKCFKCKKEKDINEFYTQKGMADGHLGKCKDCTKKDVGKRYYDPEYKAKITEYERIRFQDPDRKRKVLEYQRVRRLKNRGKNIARQVIHRLVKKGIIKRLSCEVCGDIKTEAHHPDYRKKTKVKWLCFKHHREEHGQKPN